MLVLGLAISIPLIIYGSTLILKLMNRYPVIITLGGGILGWVAGEMAITDPVVSSWVEANAHWLDTGAPLSGALFVVVIGKSLEAKKAHATEPVITAPGVASDDDAACNTQTGDQHSTESYAADVRKSTARSSSR